MKHIELHIIETARDVETACLTGLLAREDVDGLACSSCEDSVGEVDGVVYGFGLVLDETDTSWVVCLDCVAPVLSPDSPEPADLYVSLFDKDEEFDDFTLDDD
jgi:hypothetical protein